LKTATFHKKAQYEARFPKKNKKELEMISKIHSAVGKFVTKDDSIAAKLDPAFKIDTSNAE
jgi:hypothetical protein